MPSDDVEEVIGKAFTLEFYSGNLKNSASIAFSAPYANGIRAISPEQLTLPLMPPYYGDKLNLLFWDLLGVPFGVVVQPANPLTIQEGYKYVYNYIKHTFTVFNEYSERILYKTDIETLADLNIDFTIMNSHQFLVIADPDDLGGSRFIFAPTMKEHILGAIYEELGSLNNIYSTIFSKSFMNSLRVFDVPMVYPMVIKAVDYIIDHIPDFDGVNNNDLADRIRPYLPEDLDNPSWHSPMYIKDIHDFIVYHYKIYGYKFYGYDLEDLSGLNKANINWDKNCPTNYFYWNIDLVYEFVRVFEIMHGLYENLHFLIPELSTDMFPRRQPIQRDGETNNGRPLYEPWLIYTIEWGSWLEFDIQNYPPGTTVDKKDKYEVEVFDLSPWWG